MENKICPQCSKVFLPKRKAQKYCSNPCKLIGVNLNLQNGLKVNYSAEKRSLASKKTWANKEEVLRKRNTTEYCNKIGQTTRERFKDPVFREKHRRSVSRAMTLEHKQKLRVTALNRIESGNNRVIAKPNLIIADVLKILGLERNFEKPIKDICRVDFLFPELKIALEINGDYWHVNPLIYSIEGAPELTYGQNSNTQNDQRKKDLLEKECPEYRIMKLWESDVYFRLDKCIERLGTLFNKSWPIMSLSDFRVEDIPIDRAKNFCFKYHYLGNKFPVAPKRCFGLFWNECLIGCAVYALPGYVGEDGRWELARFCLFPVLPENAASWFLSRTINGVKKENKIRGLVSYSDNNLHYGTIYRATNWQEMGDVRGSYFYVNEGGERISRQHVWRHCRAMQIPEKDYVLKMGLSRIETSSKSKFLINFS